jgi:dienelactone hydrolase
MKKRKRIIFILLIMLPPVMGKSSTETITFQSANPFGFRDVITALDEQEKQEIFGFLSFPEDEKEIYPLIIGAAGSLGWSDHHYDYFDMYRKMGIATFEMRSFTSRDVESTVGTQVEVTLAMMVLDAYRALAVLSEHPKIDKDRIAITGWSLGGGVTLFSGWLPVKDIIEPDLSFSAHLAFYPPCFIEPEILDFTDAPIHILIGELDNWTPAEPCIDLVDKMRSSGAKINLTVYKDSHHSFDRSASLVISEHAYSFTDCRLKMRADGAALMNFLNIPMTSPILQKIGLAFCAERGPTFGGNPISKEMSFKFAKSFMRKHLLSN